jgi:hypothetical protein
VLVRFDHVAGLIVNTYDGIVWPAEKFRLVHSIIRLGVPQPTEWKRIGNQIDAAMGFWECGRAVDGKKRRVVEFIPAISI